MSIKVKSEQGSQGKSLPVVRCRSPTLNQVILKLYANAYKYKISKILNKNLL